MHLEALLAAHGRVLTAAQLRSGLSRFRRDAVLRTGELVRLHPGVYACGPSADQPEVRWRAALAYTGWRGALSCETGLAAHGLVVPEARSRVHVVTGRDRRWRNEAGLMLHRRTGFEVSAAGVLRRDGLAVLPLERCLVDVWHPESTVDRRAAVITAVRARRTTPAAVRRALAGVAIADRAQLVHLLDLLAAGCHSELEIWGHQHVFTAPEMPAFVRQLRVVAGGAVHYLDLAHPDSRTAIELDGWRYHGSREQQEADRQRDARLAAAGWLSLRYTSVRLHREPAAVRLEVLAVIATRSGVRERSSA